MTVTIDEHRIADEIAKLSREELIHELLHFNGAVRLDFTKEFLEGQPVDQLRHILTAAKLHVSAT